MRRLPTSKDVVSSLTISSIRLPATKSPWSRIQAGVMVMPMTGTLAAAGKQVVAGCKLDFRFVGLLPDSVARFNARRVGLKILPVKLPAADGLLTIFCIP